MRSALRQRDFRLLFAGQAVSMLGDAMVVVAIGVYVTRSTGSAANVGLVLGAYSLPLVAFVALGGVIADRFPRQRVMIVSDAVRFVCHATLAALIAFDVVEIWQMVVIGVVFGSAEAFFQPASTGLLPQTIAEEDIQAGQALFGATRELATFISPALATALVLSVSAASTFAIDAATFIVSILVLMRLQPRARGEVHVRTSVVAEMREGWDAFVSRAWVSVTVLVFSAALFFSLAPFFVLGPTVAREQYHDIAIYGILFACWGVGTFVGSIAASFWRPRRPMLAAMLWALPWPAATAIYALGGPMGIEVPVQVIAGFGIGLFGIWWHTALAERIPPHLLSRVSSYDWMGSLALLPIGYIVAGPLGDWLGAANVTAVGGAIAFVALALGLLPHSTRSLSRDDVVIVEASTGAQVGAERAVVEPPTVRT